jgi:predicted DNA-binding transcriptional regulator YafY
MSQQKSMAVKINYTNHRGEYQTRRILPVRVYFGKVEWHPESQWLLEAVDLDKEVLRTFAMKEIEWRFE